MTAARLSLPRLAWRYLWARPLLTALNLLLLTLGLAAIGFVVLVSEQLEEGMRRDLAGIDLVVGAKGSPMQILLSGVFHLDQSTGNIPLSTADALRAQPLVADVVPLSLGDSYAGHRIVGTTQGYLALYRLTVGEGRTWQRSMEAVLGAEVARRTGLRAGDRFHGSHGLGQGGAEHEHPYVVTGVLAPTGGVVDRLILTDLASVWDAHDAHGHGASSVAPPPTGAPAKGGQPVEAGEHDHDNEHDHGHEHEHERQHQGGTSAKAKVEANGRAVAKTRAEIGPKAETSEGPIGARAQAGEVAQVLPNTGSEATTAADPREISMLLVRYRSPLGAAMMPRWVNAQPGLQASVPALETARLLRMVGVGVDVLRGFGAVLLLAAALSVLVALLHAVRERQADLAMLRMLGAPPRRVAALIAMESLMLAALASVMAVALAHGLVAVLGVALAEQQSVRLVANWWSPWEALVPAMALGLALVAAAAPAWRGYRLDVTELLQTPR